MRRPCYVAWVVYNESVTEVVEHVSPVRWTPWVSISQQVSRRPRAKLEGLEIVLELDVCHELTRKVACCIRFIEESLETRRACEETWRGIRIDGPIGNRVLELDAFDGVEEHELAPLASIQVQLNELRLLEVKRCDDEELVANA